MTIFGNRSWCAICPVGALSGAANKFSKGIKFPRKLSNWVLPTLTYVGTLFVLADFTDWWSFAFWSSIWFIGIIGIAIIARFLFKGRAFCKYLCPLTAPLAVMGRAAPIELRTKNMSTYEDMHNKTLIQNISVLNKKYNKNDNSASANKKLFERKLLSNTGTNMVGVGQIDPTCKTCKTHDCILETKRVKDVHGVNIQLQWLVVHHVVFV